ncbi:MAG: hypothetical protein MUE90_05855 [Thermoanaerobaculales bacterium]|jgi:hypothetical protein|nr:hypothetical protein [Thermoanaerobaculales bacterium]
MKISEGNCSGGFPWAGPGLGACLLAIALTAAAPRPAAAQTRPTTRPPVAQQPGMAAKEIDSAALAKADARNAALALCRDLRLYSETSRTTGGLGESPALFSALKPLCAEVEEPTGRQQIGYCYGKDGGIVFSGPCATHWWEPLWDGTSWCGDIGFACMAFGGKWETR